ncbi:MAG: heme exporter protein CcmB [Bacteroidia bacterium]
MLKTTTSVKNLIKLYITLEWRQKYAVQGVLVQMFTSVFLIFLSITSISLPVWNALFWLMVLFNTMNTIAKGFLQESEGKMLYYHSLCKPEALILSKIIFNSLISLFLLLVFSAAYSLVLGFKIQTPWQYLTVAVLFTIGLSTVFTMVSAIAAGAGNNHLLIPVLGLPLMIPLLLITVKTAKKALDGIESNAIYYDMAALALLDIMVIYLAVMLYKYLWKS